MGIVTSFILHLIVVMQIRYAWYFLCAYLRHWHRSHTNGWFAL